MYKSTYQTSIQSERKNMINEFIKLRFRETVRSSIWHKNMAINIVLGLCMLYFVVCFLLIGIFLDKALIEIFPDSDPVAIFNRSVLYYIGLEMLIRFFMQQTPAMSITPFLHLPVKRSSLLHFLLARSVVNPANYFSFLIFIPFAVRAVSAYYSGAAACWWLFSLLMLIMFGIYIVTYIKRQMVVKPLVSLACGLAFIALIALDFFKIFSFSELSSALLGALLKQPLWTFVPVSLATGAYLLNFRFLMRHSYPEEFNRTADRKQTAGKTFGFMSRFGQIGELIGVELKLILRHKRTKTAIYLTPLFMLYGLIFYNNPRYDSMGWLIFVGIFVTSITMISYGQSIVAVEGGFFDGILTRKGGFYAYFRAKYFLLASFCVVCYILTTPYVFFGTKILWINTACCLFNVGVSAFIMLWFAQYNRKKIDLSQGSAMNWQGVGASQYIVMLLVLPLPIIIVYIFDWVGLEGWGINALAMLGVIGIACHKWMLHCICRRFSQAKYALAEGFRGKN